LSSKAKGVSDPPLLLEALAILEADGLILHVQKELGKSSKRNLTSIPGPGIAPGPPLCSASSL